MRTRVLRIGITANVVNILQKRDRDMVRMLLIEMAIYIYTTLPTHLCLFIEQRLKRHIEEIYRLLNS
jgi:hypothetical protein